jgi:hypothetical protein
MSTRFIRINFDTPDILYAEIKNREKSWGGGVIRAGAGQSGILLNPGLNTVL